MQRLDEVFLEGGCCELDPASIDELVGCTLDAIHNETPFLDFWVSDDGDRKLDTLLRTRYSQFFP